MSTGGELSGAGPRYYAEPRTHQRDPLDFYIEPPWTVDLLVDSWTVPALAWDPACGSGTIPKALAARGCAAFGSDIADRGFGLKHDFLGTEPAPGMGGLAQSIVCNPPYGLAEAFCRRALDIGVQLVAMLVQAKFLYSQRRHRLFTEYPPALVLHLSTRPSMPPGDKLLAGTVEPKGGKLDYSWIVWERPHDGPTWTRWAKREARR